MELGLEPGCVFQRLVLSCQPRFDENFTSAPEGEKAGSPQEQGQEALMPKARWVGWPSALSSAPLKWGSVLSWLMGNPESLGLQAERYFTHRKCQRAGDPQTLPWLSSQEQAALRRACCICLLKDLISLFLSPDLLREQMC